MATKSIGKVTIRDGKLKRVHKVSVSKKIGMKAKADRKENAWLKLSKSTASNSSTSARRAKD